MTLCIKTQQVARNEIYWGVQIRSSPCVNDVRHVTKQPVVHFADCVDVPVESVRKVEQAVVVRHLSTASTPSSCFVFCE
jgi:sporulation protein YlmC with PRC-barrel domain